MSDDFILIKYDGGDADQHAIDMRLLGESLQGIERIISDLVIGFSAQRLPKRGERAPLVVKVRQPEIGSVSIPALIQESASLLQLGWQVFGPAASEIVGNWVKSVLLFHSGRKDDAAVALDRVVELAKQHSDAMQAVDERRHAEAMGLQQLAHAIIERLGPASVQAVAPVGPSVRRLLFFTGRQRRLEVDANGADQIRSHGAIEWGPLREFILRTDGFTFHTRRLSVVHPERGGYLLAELDDPVAEQEANPYAAAVQRKGLIRVMAKAGYRGSQMERLAILDFISEESDAA